MEIFFCFKSSLQKSCWPSVGLIGESMGRKINFPKMLLLFKLFTDKNKILTL